MRSANLAVKFLLELAAFAALGGRRRGGAGRDWPASLRSVTTRW